MEMLKKYIYNRFNIKFKKSLITIIRYLLVYSDINLFILSFKNIVHQQIIFLFYKGSILHVAYMNSQIFEKVP